MGIHGRPVAKEKVGIYKNHSSAGFIGSIGVATRSSR